jgi:hypothetical protein
MENNQLKNLDKKFFVKNVLRDIAVSILFVFSSPLALRYGHNSIGFFCIALGICVVWGLMAPKFSSLEYISRIRINNYSKILIKAGLVAGVLMLIFNLSLILIEGNIANYYYNHNIIIGLILIYYSKDVLSKIKKIELMNAFDPRQAIDNEKWQWLWTLVRFIVLILMFGVIFYFILIDFNKISNDRNIEPSEVTENVYRNLAYNFRIEFPKGWKIEPGNDIDIIQKATFENSGIVIGIQKLNLQGSHEPSSVQDAIPLKTFIDQLEKVFDIIELIDYGEAIVNNEPSYWVEYLYMDANIVLEYFFLRENILYSVSARTVPDEYPGLKPLFIETITSFVFENE